MQLVNYLGVSGYVQLAMNRLISVPASPVIPRSPTWGYSRGTGGMSGRLESPSYGRGPDNSSEAVGNFEPASTGIVEILSTPYPT